MNTYRYSVYQEGGPVKSDIRLVVFFGEDNLEIDCYLVEGANGGFRGSFDNMKKCRELLAQNGLTNPISELVEEEPW